MSVSTDLAKVCARESIETARAAIRNAKHYLSLLDSPFPDPHELRMRTAQATVVLNLENRLAKLLEEAAQLDGGGK